MKDIYSKPSVTISSKDWLGYDLGPSKRVMRQIEETYPSINVLWHDDFHFASYCVANERIFTVPEERDLVQIEREHPWIKDACGRDPLTQFQAAFGFMSLCRKTQRLRRHPTTYGVKHDVESVCGIYISEGSLIRGALLAGFTLTRPRNDESCGLNILADELYYRMIDVLKSARNRVCRRTNDCASRVGTF